MSKQDAGYAGASGPRSQVGLSDGSQDARRTSEGRVRGKYFFKV